MAAVDTLKHCCRAVTADRLKERRDSAAQLRELLSNEQLCAELDRSGTDKKWPSWTHVLEASVTFFQKEMTKLESDARTGKNQTSAEQLTSQAVAPLSAVAQRANRRQTRVGVSLLTGELLAALRHPFRRQTAGSQLCALLLSALLEPAHVRCLLTVTDWRGLLGGARSLLRDPPQGVARATFLAVLTMTVEMGCRQTALLARVHDLLPLLARDGISSGSSLADLRLLNTVLALAAAGGRRAVCRLGEQLFTQVFRLADPRYQDGVLDFMQLLLCARAPSCRRDEHAAGPPLWTEQLRKMYQLVVEEVDSLCRRVSRGAPRLHVLPAKWVRLFSWVAYLLFEEGDTVVDVTQLPSCTAAEARPAKRRRLEVGVQALFLRCHETRESLECVPWLQLLTALVEAHPDVVTPLQLPPYLDLLVDWLSADSRRPEVVQHHLQLAAALLRCPAPPSTRDAVEVAWQRLWDLALKASSLVQCRAASHALLQVLLRRPSASPGSSLVCLVLERGSVASAPLVDSLAVFVRHCAVPPPAAPVADPLHTRAQLCDWLLATDEGDATVVAETLARLVLRDNTTELRLSQKPEPPRQPADQLAELSQLYLRGELLLPLQDAVHEIDVPSATDVGASVIASLRARVMTAVAQQLEAVAQRQRDSDAAAGGECATQWCRDACTTAVRAATLLRVWSDCGLLALVGGRLERAVAASRLRELTATLLTATASQLNRFVPSHAAAITELLAHLSALFSVAADVRGIGVGRRALARLLTAAALRDFIQSCLHLLRDDDGRLVPAGRRAADDTGSASGLEPLSSDCLDFGEEAPPESGSGGVLTTPLHQLERLRLQLCTTLVTIVTMDVGEEKDDTAVAEDADRPRRVVADMLACLLEGRLEVHFPGDLRIAMHLLRTLPAASALHAYDVGSFADLLLLVCRHWPRDVHVSEAVLQLMAAGYVPLVVRLGSSAHRADVMKFVGVMQKKAELAMHGERWLLDHLRLLAALACVDPVGRWAVLEDGRWVGEPLLRHLSEPAEPVERTERDSTAWSTHRSRMSAADLLHAVFAARERETATDGAAPPPHKMFATVYSAAAACVAAAAAESDEYGGDEAADRAAALCTALARVALGSVTCRPRALFALCQSTRLRGVRTAAVLATLRRIAEALGLAGPRCLLAVHLDYVVPQWLSERLPLLEFPHALMEYTTAAEFVGEHVHCVVPHLVGRHDDQLAAVAGLLQQTPAALVLDSLPQIVANTLPALAAAAAAAAPAGLAPAQRVYSAAQQTVGGAEEWQSALATRTADVVTALVRAHGTRPQRLATCVRYASENMFGDGVVPSLQRPADALQRVLLAVASDAAAAAGTNAAADTARCYCALITIVADEFAQLEHLRPFVLLDVTAFVTHRLAELRLPADAAIAVDYVRSLSRLCDACGRPEPSTVATRLEPLCSSLVQLHTVAATADCAAVKEAVTSALELLLGDLSDGYSSAVAALTCLPADGPLAALRATPTAGALNRLVTDVPLGVHALRTAFAELESSSKPPPSCPSGLLARLLQLAATADGQLRRAAAQLLGALGPRPLSGAIVRAPAPAWQRVDCAGSDATRDVHLLWRLHDMLTDRDVSVVGAAGEALRAMLAQAGGPAARDLLTAEVPDFAKQLHPFYASRQQLERPKPLSSADAIRKIDSPALWTPENGRYESWLRNLTLALVEVGSRVSPELAAYAPLCHVTEADFCLDVLPYAARAALLSDKKLRAVMSRWMNRLLEEHRVVRERESCTVVSSSSSTVTTLSLAADGRCVQALLQVVLYLRRQPLPATLCSADTAWQRHFWLDVSLSAAAGAALSCGLLCEAVLLAEVCCYVRHRGGDEPLLGRDADGRQLRALLLDAHLQLGDADGAAGLAAADDADGQLTHREQESDWLRALNGYDARAGERTESVQRGLLRCLVELQLLGTAQTQLRALTAQLPQPDAVPKHLLEARCECAWRLADWSVPVPVAAAPPGLHQALYSCLAAYRDGDRTASAAAVDAGRAAVLAGLAGPAPPSAAAAVTCLAQLRLLHTADQLCSADGARGLAELCSRWLAEPDCDVSFSVREPQLAFRVALLAVSEARHPVVREARQLRHHTLLRLSERARAAGRLAASERAAAQLPADLLLTGRCLAENSWARGSCEQALWRCRGLLEEQPAEQLAEQQAEQRRLQLAQLRVLYAGWLSEQHAESPQTILQQHLLPAIAELERLSDGAGSDDALLEAHHLAGQYADSQFQRLDELVESPAFADKQAEVKRMRDEAEEFGRRVADPSITALLRKDLSCKQLMLRRQAEMDESELNQCDADRASFQRQAIDGYLRCLRLGVRRDVLMYRVVALWLADASGQVCAQLQPAVPQLASHKFVPLLQQLAARLGRHGWLPESAALLEQLLLRCAADHPHHALPVLLALKHARADSGTSAPAADGAGELRTKAAHRLLDRLCDGSALTQHVRQLEEVSLALIQLAYHKYTGADSQGQVPADCSLARLGQLPAVVVPTIPLLVRQDAEYTTAATIVRWDRNYRMVGGVNAPKKLRCLGSDGLWRPQLLKGHDDLRQDAVMQQVFSVLNVLLAERAAPDQHRLSIRTYKVVPLSQRCGILEWCVDTQPLSDYLTGAGGAHQRHRPDDMTVRKARAAMTAVAKRSAERKRDAFADVCRRLQPVLRHFFWERFPAPNDWYERRVAYTNSVAAASISGYVLGLGDRHVSNILIDEATAEVVHIDLGVAFETGRLLPTPETVPFRLTRDLVDGMGVTGVDGRFRRSCERTMAALRDSRQVVLTIVRVLLDDPLYAWTLTADKVNRLQQRRVTQRVDNRQAERALARLAEKLRGQELGQVMTCSAQVGHLIQQARDYDNLCRLFSGWQAYL